MDKKGLLLSGLSYYPDISKDSSYSEITHLHKVLEKISMTKCPDIALVLKSAILMVSRTGELEWLIDYYKDCFMPDSLEYDNEKYWSSRLKNSSVFVNAHTGEL